ncbi:MAG: GTP-binding protein [Candidatus Malihini olakiniferum]
MIILNGFLGAGKTTLLKKPTCPGI